MKAEQVKPEPAFQPVALILETQEEVDAVYALFNLGPLINAVGLVHPWKTLSQFHNEDNGTSLYLKARDCLRKELL